MYSNPRLDTPPPPSQFRRPWSPEPYHPLPSSTERYGAADLYRPQRDDYPSYPTLPHTRREASDASIEDVDLVEYARRLRAQDDQDPYPSYQPSYDSPPSRDSLRLPSLVSHPTLSSSTSSPRPFSLPSASHAAHSPEPYVSASYANSEVDISQFPPWSRGWYKPPHTLSYDDLAPSQGHLPPGKPPNKSIFDPTYTPPPFSSPLNSDVIPWSASEVDHVDPSTKEERIKMLEREFGDTKPKVSPFTDEQGNPLVGTVQNGKLITQGPKKRLALRIMQILLAGGACVPGVYAAVVIKPKTPAPPSNKPPAFVLYITSALTFLLLSYMFLIRPCCCGAKRKSHNPMGYNNGMMVLPVNANPNGKKKKKGKKKGDQTQDVQVNLIVDPRAFAPPESDEETGYDSPHDKPTGRKPRRRGIFEGLAMEEDWRLARAWAKKVAVVDGLGTLVWGAVFVFVLIGKRCPSGGFDGWCNAYNVSSASACLLCVAFGVGVFFDVKDLSASKVSPRTRM